ncbi:MAG TPA: DUF11 domain-containing protein [Anaerolineae bacterium]|nr:DUF11 domain-containing protein [Anaerolineae bacterium]
MAGTDEIGYSNNNFVIEHPAGGPWSGLMVYNGGTFTDVVEGDYVRLLGKVDEYNGMTELSIRYAPNAQQVISSGNPLPTPEVIATGDYVNADTAEQWESVLIEFQGATVTDEDLGYGEWAFDDGSGTTRADDFGEKDGDLTYAPVLNDYYGFIRGIGWYSYGNYKLEPRYDADVDLDYPVTFRYHDAEDVVHSGEAVYLAGDFNSWSTTATSMTVNADYSLFTVTVILTDTGTYEYKYIVYTDTVPSGPTQWDWLNTYNRSLTVTQSFQQQDDYRDVVISWARLQWPSTLTVNLGETSDSVYGRLFVNNVTNPAGEGRGLQAQVGYGNDVDPANWSWSPMTYNTDDWNNDEFMGTITPTARGVYSYAVRFDGNWGMGNPNAGWVYADLDGYAPFGDPFELGRTGVMTVTAPNLSPAKAVTPTADIEPGDSVTYTLTLSNSGDGAATGVVLTDALPAGVSFGGWVQQGNAMQAGNVINWTGDVSVSNMVTIIFTAAVGSDLNLYGQTIINTVSFTSANAGSGSDDAAFGLVGAPALSVAKEVTPTGDVALGGVVTYTILLSNAGASAAYGVVLTDALPSGVSFGGWVQQGGAVQAGNVITWTGDVAVGNAVTLIFTATLSSDPAYAGQTITNTAAFASTNAGSGSDDAAFAVAPTFRIYLPLVVKNR